MVDVNELRRGNLVQDESGIWQYVYQIWPYGCELADSMRGDGDLDHRSEEIFPIPLTSEVLKKGGFKEIEETIWAQRVGGVYLQWYANTGFMSIGGRDCKPVKTLHGLQNRIFSLTGEELEITI